MNEKQEHCICRTQNIYLCYVQGRCLFFVYTTDFLDVLRLVASRPLNGVMMSIKEMSLPTAVQVHGIRGLNTSHLQLYFDRSENGGDSIVDFRETENDDCVIVEYQSSEGTYMSAKNMLQGQTIETEKVAGRIIYLFSMTKAYAEVSFETLLP